MESNSINSIQKFKIPQCVIIFSKLVVEIEKFEKYLKDQTFYSAKVNFYECDIEWYINCYKVIS